MVLKNRKDEKIWEIVNVYGPVQHERKDNFLKEILEKCMNAHIPILIGRDFNMVRSASEKSNENINRSWTDKFNDCIAKAELRELHRLGGKYT